tara:strand:+ start:890 stop:1039 length:150 start_codon:yes stop_codon:yes gene_type:complete
MIAGQSVHFFYFSSCCLGAGNSDTSPSNALPEKIAHACEEKREETWRTL